MKQLKKLIILGLILVLYSCGYQVQEPAPVMPKYSTDKGKACARECQLIYASCNDSCIGFRGHRDRGCLSNCNQLLGECYSTCE